MMQLLDEPNPSASPAPLIDISILIPTRNERENVDRLIGELTAAMSDLGRTWELLFVDDSDDDTPELIREVQLSYPHVLLLHREPGQREGGLGSAVAMALGEARGHVMVVMDGDLQHPPQMVRELSTVVLSGAYDLAIASRYIANASNSGLDGTRRRVVSRISIALTHFLVPPTREIRDPMSGFFAIARESLVGVELHPHGFKILMEVLARSGKLRVAEVPFRMSPRLGGRSKASWREGMSFLRHSGRLVRSRVASSLRPRRLINHVPLVAILAVQAILSYRLVFRNTAFIDEATYLTAGHYELHTLMHGGPNLFFPSYFSGAPTIYPVLAALVDNLGGLHAARFLSLVFMLLATVLCYDTSRRLWGRPAGWLAAGIFVTTQGTQFLGALATFDAMSLMLVALAAWAVVRYAGAVRTSSAVYLVVPVLLLANATKYASAIFDPIVFLLAFLIILQRHELRTALRTSANLLATFGVVLGLVLTVIPGAYLTGISSTTLNRTPASAATSVVLHDAWSWVGAIACLALLSAVLAAASAWRGKSDWVTAAMIAVLAIAILVVPANQARIHTTTSLFKHVTFGAWFAAIGVGWLARAAAALPWRPTWRVAVAALASAVTVVALTPLMIAGTAQAGQLDREWPNSTQFVSALRPLVTRLNRPVLLDDSTIAAYYLENRLALPYWYNTFYLSYVLPGTNIRVSGPAAYRAAIEHDWFSVVALNWSTEKHIDNVVAAAIRKNKNYVWVGDYAQPDAFGHSGAYVVWRLRTSAT